jgi:hypothetical protein
MSATPVESMPPDTCAADRPRKRVRTAGPQQLEVLVAELRDIICAGIDLVLEPVPVAALLDLAARQMEDCHGARQHALNAFVDRAATGSFQGPVLPARDNLPGTPDSKFDPGARPATGPCGCLQ